MKRILILSGSSLFRESIYSVIINASEDVGVPCETFVSETVCDLIDECRERESAPETAGQTCVFIDLFVDGISTIEIAEAFNTAVPQIPVVIHLPYSEFDIFTFYEITPKNVIAVIDRNSSIARVYSLTVTFLTSKESTLPAHFRLAGLIQGTIVFREKDFLSKASIAIGKLHTLSPAEELVFYYMAFGFDDNELSEKLNISPNTVRRHIQSIKNKLNEFSRYKLVSMSIFTFMNTPWRKKIKDFEIPAPGISWSRKEDIFIEPLNLIKKINECKHPEDWS